MKPLNFTWIPYDVSNQKRLILGETFENKEPSQSEIDRLELWSKNFD